MEPTKRELRRLKKEIKRAGASAGAGSGNATCVRTPKRQPIPRRTSAVIRRPSSTESITTVPAGAIELPGGSPTGGQPVIERAFCRRSAAPAWWPPESSAG